ncbi:MAG: hypothetical protein JWP57_4251 [Spirosoma sp.]|nr:hypothetical protein [Spirosoma sp.]
MNRAPFISAAMRAQCEDLLTLHVCERYEAELQEYDDCPEQPESYFNPYNDPDDSGPYGWKTTGYRDGAMIW